MNKPTFTNSIPYTAVTSGNLIKQNFATVIEKSNYNITVDQYCILIVLSEQNGISQTLLAFYLEKTNPSMTRIIRSMEKKGFISRSTGSDARNKEVFITELGVKVYNNLAPLVTNHSKEVFVCLSKEEEESYLYLMNKIKKHINTM